MSVLTVRKGAYVPGVVTNLTTSGTANTMANTVGQYTSIVRISVNQDTYVEIIEAAATANSMMMTAGSTEFLAVVPNTTKVSVLQVTTSGIASITELGGYNQPGSYGSTSTNSPGAPYVSGT